MLEVSPEAEIHEVMIAEGFRLSPPHAVDLRYRGQIQAQGRSIACEIWFRDLSFAKLPKLTIIDPELRAHSVAHFEDGGYYCYTGSLSQVIDKYDVRGAVRTALNHIATAIGEHFRADIYKDIAAEFVPHWLPSKIWLADFRLTGNRDAHRKARDTKSEHKHVLVDEANDVSCFGRLIEVPSKTKFGKLPVIAFDGDLTFLNGQSQPENLKECYLWLCSLEKALAERFLGAFQLKAKPVIDCVIIEARNATIAVQFEVKQAHKNAARGCLTASFVKTTGGAIPIERIAIQKGNLEVMLNRNLRDGAKPLLDKRIVLIGCGTIGSHLAKMLVQSGAGFGDGSLLMVDNELLGLENIGRHFLGQNSLQRNKATACADELKRLYPEASIRGINANAIEELDHYKNVDLIIDATGEDQVSIVINEWLLAAQVNNPNLVGLFVGLFGNADAAQALLMEADNGACLKCLKPEHDRPWRYDPLRDSTKIEKAVGTCGDGNFIPYGVGGSVIAAGLANNIALDWARGDPAPKMRTIRIKQSTTVVRKDVNPEAHKKCPACNRANSDG